MNSDFLPNFKYIFTNPFFLTRRYLYLFINQLSKKIGKGKLLDIGCGTKPYQGFFKEAEYVGMDYAHGINVSNPNADVFYDGKHFPFPDSSFEYVLATEVLEHVFNPDDFLREIERVLKKDGLGIITVPFIWDEHEIPYDFGRYTSFGIKAILERNGFEVLEQHKTGNFIVTLGQLFCTYLYYIISPHRIFYKVSLPFVFAPIQIFTLFLSRMLPSHQGFYLDNILLVRKVSR
ncbi:class I SAM-dependent methyltransferase [Leptospira sp. 'Mane']|uniref:class I SAM-dependent methyltransferase n=1 Tax=Leptospira sp. 'Mane' TaxID=3387407 RepID=UPI00398BA7D1